MLKALGIKSTKEHLVPPASYIKLLNAKLLQLSSEMTSQQFWKFRIDWDIFTKMINLTTAQTNIQLYNCASETIKKFYYQYISEFFNTSSDK